MALYNRNGILIGINEFARLLSDLEYKRVAFDELGDDANTCISTVWLGTDHNWSDEGPPIIFETMIFSDDESIADSCWRYATEKEARENHEKIVLQLAANKGIDYG